MNEAETPRTWGMHEKYSAYENGRYKAEVIDVFRLAEQLERDLTAVTKQRDALAEALQKLADCDWVITVPNRMDAVREIANKALQSITPNKL